MVDNPSKLTNVSLLIDSPHDSPHYIISHWKIKIVCDSFLVTSSNKLVICVIRTFFSCPIPLKIYLCCVKHCAWPIPKIPPYKNTFFSIRSMQGHDGKSCFNFQSCWIFSFKNTSKMFNPWINGHNAPKTFTSKWNKTSN